VTGADMFDGLARHYDAINSHVFYDRWLIAVSELAGVFPPGPLCYCDAACGTGKLLGKLAGFGQSVGFDLSAAMLRTAVRNETRAGLVRADMRAVPFSGAFHLVTCLFDSINFLLDPADVRRALRELAGSLRPGGLLYVDIVTERMVLEHFDGQSWTEKNQGISTRWHSAYDKASRVCNTEIRVNTAPATLLRERVYDLGEFQSWLREAGLEPAVTLDAENWRPVKNKTLRVDIVAGKDLTPRTNQAVADVFKSMKWHGG
jgi:SAM-dependent methyltransferase